MRTKALFCAAALAAGAISSMAQSNVYSLNVVGYYNVTVPANGFYMIANQLNTTNNTIANVLANAQDGDQFYKYNGSYSSYTYDGLALAWTPNGNATLAPGEGGFYKNNTATAETVTFVGEVMQGSLTNPVPINAYAIRSSIVPQAGTLQGVLGYPGEDGDQAYVYAGTYSTYTYDALTPGWTPGDVNGPALAVGQAFFSHKSSTSTQSNWVRNFTVQ